MINSEKQLYIQETEEKPNHLAVIVMMLLMAIIVVCWVANELGLFRVDKAVMRFGMIISIAITIIPVLILAIDKGQYSNPKIKYFMLFSCFGYTLTTTSLLTFHTELILILPMFLAMLYRSKSLGGMALAATILCTICSPILGCLIGAWDVPLLKGLIHIATAGTVEIIDPTYIISWDSILRILTYNVLPRVMIITPCAVLMFHVISIGTDHVRSEILLNGLNNRDMLTGLYNQNYYKQYVAGSETSGKVGVMYFDINGLKDVNDNKGHECGDLLIKKCAASVETICDDGASIAFRIGGDEFLAVIEGADEAAVHHKIDEWRNALAAINQENNEERNGLVCSMAMGYSIGDFSEIESLARCADAQMYKNKASVKTKEKKEM